MPRIPPRLTRFARELRTGATRQERKVWRLIRHHRPRFTRQHVVGNYILDIACREAKLAVELDGSQHLDDKADDEKRTVFLESLGWRVIRFWNSEVTENPDGVAEAIILEVAARLQRTHPQPLPVFREGGKEREPA
jgi:BirA family biotin operon repressor/biotin-[acetyl-CoA-carboxylase] ligase